MSFWSKSCQAEGSGQQPEPQPAGCLQPGPLCAAGGRDHEEGPAPGSLSAAADTPSEAARLGLAALAPTTAITANGARAAKGAGNTAALRAPRSRPRLPRPRKGDRRPVRGPLEARGPAPCGRPAKARAPTAPRRPLPASLRPGPQSRRAGAGPGQGRRDAAGRAARARPPRRSRAPPPRRQAAAVPPRRRSGLPGLGPPRGTASPSHCLSASRRAPCPPSCLSLRSAPAARKRAPNPGWQRKGSARSGRAAERRDADGAAFAGRRARAPPGRPPPAMRVPAGWALRPVRRPCPVSAESPCRCRPRSRVPRWDLRGEVLI